VYKLGKNWQTRAWHPVFKTARSAKEKLHTNGFLSILQEEFLPCPVHHALFHNFGFCYIILMGHKQIKKKMNNSV
jgi:hypothetical protein